MTSHTGRLYAIAIALVALFLAWAVVAARPWTTSTADPRLKALAQREAQLRHEAKLVNALVAQRWATYRAALEAQQLQRARLAAAATRSAQASIASAPVSSSAVRVVNLPPLTITRTS